MILSVDIGNTNITLGGFSKDTLLFVARISTDASKTSDEYAEKILGTLSLYNKDRLEIKGCIISSVVPPLTAIIKQAVKFIYSVEPIVVAPGIKTGINIHCDTPSSVGSDLICACVACHKLYSSPAIIVDMGTATKIMVTDKNGTFIGVSITPGAIMGLKALSEGTAQLPQVSLEAPSCVIGKNTADCMKSGVVFGHAAMIDGMIDRFCKEIGSDVTVYATGGLAPVIIPHCKHKMILDENMVLKGLNIIYNKNN